MKLPQVIKSLSLVEISFLIIFIVYLVLPINTPEFMKGPIESPLGMLTIFIITISLFFYSNPILAIVYVFVAYELLRRSAQIVGRSAYVQYTPSQVKKDMQLQAMNPPKTESLEEEIVQKMAPIGHSDPVKYTSSSFKPVAQKIDGASMY
jgi:uncharacterized membrane protein (DUF485 family)